MGRISLPGRYNLRPLGWAGEIAKERTDSSSSGSRVREKELVRVKVKGN